MTTHRNFGIASGPRSGIEHEARSTRDAIQTRNVIQFARQVHPPANGVVNLHDSTRAFFIPGSSPFKRGVIAQAAIDCLMVVFGTFFCCVFTVALSAGIYSLLVFIVD